MMGRLWSNEQSRLITFKWVVELGPALIVLAGITVKLVHLTRRVSFDWTWLQTPEERLVLGFGLAAVTLLASGAIWLSRTKRLVAFLALNASVSLLILAYSVHVRFFGDAPSMAELQYVHQLVPVASSVLHLLKPTDGIYFADVVLLAILLPFYARIGGDARPGGHAGLATSVKVLLVATVLLTTMGFAAATDPEAYRWVVNNIYVSEPVFGEGQRQAVLASLRERREGGAAASRLFGVARRRSLILISAESLESFPIDLEVFGQPVAPNLARFAAESLRFTQFWDQTWKGGTSDAEFASLQSLHPLRFGAIPFRHVLTQYRALPRILADVGYQTLSAVGAPGDLWRMKDMHRRLGFQRSFYEDSFCSTERGGWMPDIDFFHQVVAFLETSPRPLMAFLLSSSNHHPFKLPARDRHLRLGSLESTRLGDYLQSVHYFDRAFGQFIAALRAHGLLDASIVALYGDHRAFLDADEELVRILGLPDGAAARLWAVHRNTPFLIRLPHAQHAGRIASAGGHLDIAPTLLSLLGIATTNEVLLGRDLTGPGVPLVVFRDGAFATNEYYTIRQKNRDLCFGSGTGEPVDCPGVNSLRRRAEQQLQISDTIIGANLIPALRAEWR